MNQKKDYYDLDDLFDNVPKNIERTNVEENFLDKRNVKLYNATQYNDKTYQCEKCKNKGKIAYLDEYGIFNLKDCECYRIRLNRKKMEKLGLLNFLDENNSFETMVSNENWQQHMISIAKNYVENFDNEWLLVCGSVGSGKTKLCSIVFSKILEKKPNAICEYLQWDADCNNLTFPSEKEKDNVNALIEDYKNCDILYIDDFLRLKSKKDFNSYLSNTAKAIINYRYINKLTTIISSELYYNELEELDEAIATRIYQMCGKGEHIISIKRDKGRNMRKGIEII